MKVTKSNIGAAAGTIGTAGAVAAACVACCVGVPVVGPLLAWLGLSSLGAVLTAGWYLPVAGLFILGLGIVLLVRHRRSIYRAHGTQCAQLRVWQPPPKLISAGESK